MGQSMQLPRKLKWSGLKRAPGFGLEEIQRLRRAGMGDDSPKTAADGGGAQRETGV
jgi:hypothetical protein